MPSLCPADRRPARRTGFLVGRRQLLAYLGAGAAGGPVPGRAQVSSPRTISVPANRGAGFGELEQKPDGTMYLRYMYQSTVSDDPEFRGNPYRIVEFDVMHDPKLIQNRFTYDWWNVPYKTMYLVYLYDIGNKRRGRQLSRQETEMNRLNCGIMSAVQANEALKAGNMAGAQRHLKWSYDRLMSISGFVPHPESMTCEEYYKHPYTRATRP